MRIAQIRSMDISNGPGIGISLFTNGCPIRCPGCHNSSIWDPNGGVSFSHVKHGEKILKMLDNKYITRFSILGGEPIMPDNVTDLMELVMTIKAYKPDVKIWLYSGYTLEQLVEWVKTPNDKFDSFERSDLGGLLSSIDVLVDGPYIQEQRDVALKFKGSTNQRIIDMRETDWWNHGKVVELDF